jgi:CBS domain-containing protein
MANEHIPIGAITDRPVVFVDADATLRDAAEVLDRETIGVAIVRGTGSTALISERDIVRALAEGVNPDRERVGNVATLDVEVIESTEPIADAVHKMLENEIRHLPVLRGDRIVGVVSVRDVLTALSAPSGAVHAQHGTH